MVEEESSAMPIEIDITQNAMFKSGERRGEVNILKRVLERRFGPLPESIRARIDSADVESLDRWVDRLDAAGSLDAVFAD
jgi:hypothetical protein